MSTALVVPSQTDRINEVFAATLNGIGRGSRPAYAGSIRDYLAWADDHHNSDAYSSLLAYRQHLEERGLQISTINRILSAVKNFLRTAYNMGVIDEASFRRSREVKSIPSQGQKRGNWLTLEEAQCLLDVPDRQAWIGLRDRAILAVMLGAGLRRSEVSSLRWDHLKQVNGAWIIENLKGKHNRVRTIPLQTWVAKAIMDYAIKNDEMNGSVNQARVHLPDTLIFTSIDRHGNRRGSITSAAIWLIVKRYAAQCGIAKLAPHDLRRTYAKLIRDSGGQLEEVQELLGHSSLAVTQRYLEQGVDPQRISQLIPLET